MTTDAEIIDGLHLRVAFYESIMRGQRAHGRICKIADAAGLNCCNPKCNGEWGTGCWCCHYLQFTFDADPELMKAHLALSSKSVEPPAQTQPTDSSLMGFMRACAIGSEERERAERFKNERNEVLNALRRVLDSDNDDKFDSSFDAVAEGTGITILHPPVRAPNANAVCERFLRSVRRECLDHVIILGELHLRTILDRYCEYFNGARPHQGIDQRVPTRPSDRSRTAGRGSVMEIPILGGLHHKYRLAA